MDVVRLMNLCKISRLNRMQVDQLCLYNKKQRSLSIAEIILISTFLFLDNTLLSIPISVISIGCLSLILYERLTIKKKIISLINRDSPIVCECRLKNTADVFN